MGVSGCRRWIRDERRGLQKAKAEKKKQKGQYLISGTGTSDRKS